MDTSLTHTGERYPTHYQPSGGYLARPQPSGLADVINIILDKGIVIDAFVRVSLVGIELLTIDARIVIASVDTYLRFAEAVNRLNLGASNEKPGLPQLVEGVVKARKTAPAKEMVKPAKKLAHGAVQGAKRLAAPAGKTRRKRMFGRGRK